MPSFLYQVLPSAGDGEPDYFQMEQDETEEPLAAHPHTGAKWERVLNDDGTPVILPPQGACGCGARGCCS